MSKMNAEFIRAAESRSLDNAAEVERLRAIIERASRTLMLAPGIERLVWLAGRLERMNWVETPPQVRAAAVAIASARDILAEAGA